MRTCFDRMWAAGMAHCGDGFCRGHTQFGQQFGRDGAGPTQAALAMDEHVEAIAQAKADLRPDFCPQCLEPLIGRRHVGDWQVEPVHVPCSCGLAYRLDLQGGKLVILYQADDCAGIPVADCIVAYSARETLNHWNWHL